MGLISTVFIIARESDNIATLRKMNRVPTSTMDMANYIIGEIESASSHDLGSYAEYIHAGQKEKTPRAI